MKLGPVVLPKSVRRHTQSTHHCKTNSFLAMLRIEKKTKYLLFVLNIQIIYLEKYSLNLFLIDCVVLKAVNNKSCNWCLQNVFFYL